MKKFLSLCLAMIVCIQLCVPALAVNSDGEDANYADELALYKGEDGMYYISNDAIPLNVESDISEQRCIIMMRLDT